ncbi:Asp-tRNA(Asn)/Glu-tRNA(Gln) amidotransferase subunit GatA [Litoribrevibacter euphylliae]|uniref:Glutamyl-tRNA(Gln) amidotransferase subunit A n=1 Tax=Litoribrevibacter euphylliae TaxID=1834034 RepID=A0ABV7HG68_9GAMM
MHNKTLAELAQGLESGDFSSVELTTHYLNRIKSLDDKTNAFITTTEEQALAQAKQADQLRSAGNASQLTGIPIAHKDIFCTEGVKTSCGSKMLDNFIAPYESTVTQKCNDAGLVMLGKTNMDEFAMGSTNESSFYGACHNPWDLEKIPGGSSGGSAAAVAARLAPIATGTDTGGSIRQPASMCNITGLKPTYGRVSRWGMIAFASSLDQAGPMAQTAEDAAMLLNTMAGLDLKDSTSMDQPVEDYTAGLNNGLEGLKIGLPKEYFAEGLNDSVKAAIEASIKELEKQGAILKEISLSTANLSVPAYYVIAPAEASANLSRFDGVRYGYRCEDPENLEDLYKRSRGEGFGDEVKRRIMIGAYALSAGYYDAYYKKAQQVRRLIKNDFANAFNEVDVIAGPTAPTTAFKLGEMTNDPVTMYLEDIFTLSVNLAGLPALTVPAGFADGMPTGLQLIGNYFQEAKLLNIGHKYQLATDWHKKTPEQFA